MFLFVGEEKSVQVSVRIMGLDVAKKLKRDEDRLIRQRAAKLEIRAAIDRFASVQIRKT